MLGCYNIESCLLCVYAPRATHTSREERIKESIISESSSRVEEEEGLNDEGAEQIGAKDKESNTGGADLQPNAQRPRQIGGFEQNPAHIYSFQKENSLCWVKSCDVICQTSNPDLFRNSEQELGFNNFWEFNQKQEKLYMFEIWKDPTTKQLNRNESQWTHHIMRNKLLGLAA